MPRLVIEVVLKNREAFIKRRIAVDRREEVDCIKPLRIIEVEAYQGTTTDLMVVIKI